MVLISTDYTTLLHVTKFTGGVLELPDSVKTIGIHAFKGCTDFSTIEIPNTVTEIGYGAFAGCQSLSMVIIPDSVTKIGPWAFAGCYGIKSITIPSSVKEIGSCAFYNCCGLETIKFPDSLGEIAYGTFEGCTNLTKAEIPSVKKIGNNAFNSCMKLRSIQIPSSVTEIGDFAFFDCLELLDYEIPSTVTKTGKMVFGTIDKENISRNWKFRKYVTNDTLATINSVLSQVEEESFTNSKILKKRIDLLKKYMERNEIIDDRYVIDIFNVVAELENIIYKNRRKYRILQMRIKILKEELLEYGYFSYELLGNKYVTEVEKDMTVSFLCNKNIDDKSLFISEVKLPRVERFEEVIIQKGEVIIDSNNWWIRLYRKICSLLKLAKQYCSSILD